MKLINLTLKDLLTNDSNLTFLVGAGCSVDAPSCLSAGRTMIEAMIKYSCSKSEIKKILELENLRFEQVLEIIRYRLDPTLKIIDYYGECDKPNLQHFFLAGMIKKGHFVMTTNFDFLIEHALAQSGVPKDEIFPVITRQDFERYSNPNELKNERKKTVYKIHGSTKNVISGLDTRDSLVATIQAFGSGKEGENVFQVESFKRPLFNNISDNRTLVVLGYSGSDDFDIVPTLMVLKNLKNIIWIEYVLDDGGIEKIYEINDSTFEKSDKSDKIQEILTKIYKMHNSEHIYRVEANTTRLLGELMEVKPDLDTNNFSISPMTWLMNNVTPPDEIDNYLIPYKIYDDFGMIDDALKCSKMVLKNAKKKKDRRWESVALNNIGLLLKGKGDLDGALKHYQEALEITEQLGDLSVKSTILSNIGSILDDRGDLDGALKHYQEALEIDEQLGDLRY
ncbi:MAG: tetratricopeptide repeat protein [Promethearchaeota archaeon]